MECYIKCAKCNKNNKFIILTALFGFLTNFIFGHVYNNNMDLLKLIDTDNQILLSYHIIYHYIFRFLGVLFISLILLLIKKEDSQKKQEENYLEARTNESSAIILIYNDVEEDLNSNINNISLNIFIVITIMVIQRILEDLFYKSNLRALDFWMLELPLVSYLNYKILNFKIHRHHYLVIYINLILGLIYKITSFILNYFLYNSDDDSHNLYYKFKQHKWLIPLGIIIYLIYMIPRAYAISKIKVFMDLKFISPYKLLIIYGLLGTLISAIVGTISTFFKCPKNEINICNISNDKNETFVENFYLYWKSQTNFKNIFIEIIIILFGMISNFFFEFLYILTIKYLTPMHIIFVNLIYSTLLFFFGNLYHKIKNKQQSKRKQEDLLSYIGLIIKIIVFFGLLIYLEIIVLNFCNFNYDLRVSIIERSTNEYEKDKIEKINLSKDDDDDEEDGNEEDGNGEEEQESINK